MNFVAPNKSYMHSVCLHLRSMSYLGDCSNYIVSLSFPLPPLCFFMGVRREGGTKASSILGDSCKNLVPDETEKRQISLGGQDAIILEGDSLIREILGYGRDITPRSLFCNPSEAFSMLDVTTMCSSGTPHLVYNTCNDLDYTLPVWICFPAIQ